MGPLPQAARHRAALLRVVPRREPGRRFHPAVGNTHGAGGARRRGFEGAEAVVQNPDGKRWVARVNVAPPRDEDGPVVGAINCFQDVTLKHDVRQAMERQQRTFDLAMTASQIGTWRYIMTDNICVYDDNAQRLYGLTEARFLRDEDGVKAKFHPDDMKVMRARVAKALDPEGDGRYDVVYRVKQLDGSCRGLSAPGAWWNSRASARSASRVAS